MDGILNINKPLGLTSHDVVAQVRRAAGQKRVGHAGTLDPLATGVLLVCLGRATRLVEYLMGQKKVYETTIKLGQSTATYDAEGEITLIRPVPALTLDQLEEALNQFRGEIQQVPPMYSALKQKGQPLYKLARAGVEVERSPRPVTIYELTLVSWQSPELKIEIHCSAGTYIRSLAHDLGELLGCGGHLTALKRTAVGSFTTDQAVECATLNPTTISEALLPLTAGVQHLPHLTISDEMAQDLINGKTVVTEQPAGLTAAFTAAGQFVGLISAADGVWRAEKMFPET